MGYYIWLTESEFAIPETPEVLQEIYKLNERDDLKRGGSSEGEQWFAWMNPDLTTYKSVQEVFQALGFGTELEDGLVHLTGYDSKAGSEDVFLWQVAKFVKDGSYMEWQGESSEDKYRYVVHEGKLCRAAGRVVYDEIHEYEPFDYTKFWSKITS